MILKNQQVDIGSLFPFICITNDSIGIYLIMMNFTKTRSKKEGGEIPNITPYPVNLKGDIKELKKSRFEFADFFLDFVNAFRCFI